MTRFFSAIASISPALAAVLGMLIVQDQIWGRVTANRSMGKATWYFADELLALMEVEEEPPAVCSCTVKCEAGAVNTACPVCANNMTACAGKAPEPQEPEEPEPPAKENKGGMPADRQA